MFSSIQSRVNLPVWMSSRTRFISALVSAVTTRGPGDVFAIFGGVRDRVVHVGDAALVDQVDDQLHFVQALEIGHFRRVAGFHQRLEAGADQLDEAAAKRGLLAEQTGLALFLEGGLDERSARRIAAIAEAVGQAEIVGVARSVLMDGDQAGHAAALEVFAAARCGRGP